MLQKIRNGVIAFLLGSSFVVHGQVTIGEGGPGQPYSILEISTKARNGGLRLPQMTTADRNSLNMNSSDVKGYGLAIFNTTTNCVDYWNGSQWISLCNEGNSTGSGGLTGKCPNGQTSISDIEGNVYGVKNFGIAGCWMTENLRAFLTKDGVPIADAFTGNNLRVVWPVGTMTGSGSSTVNDLNSPPIGNGVAKTEVANSTQLATAVGTVRYFTADPSNPSVFTPVIQSIPEFVKKFGLLYSQPEAARGCPEGWHLPTAAEWDFLGAELGGAGMDAGKKMKADNLKYNAAMPPNNNGFLYGYPVGDPKNSGFNALPAGARWIISNGGTVTTRSYTWGSNANFWSADPIIYQVVTGGNDDTPTGQIKAGNVWIDSDQQSNTFKNTSISVRCAKDL